MITPQMTLQDLASKEICQECLGVNLPNHSCQFAYRPGKLMKKGFLTCPICHLAKRRLCPALNQDLMRPGGMTPAGHRAHLDAARNERKQQANEVPATPN